jgi:HlyD family secretion protein
MPPASVALPLVPPLHAVTSARVRVWWFVAAFVLVAIGVALVFLLHKAPVTGIEASGTIEATESDVAPKVGGRLAQLRVRDGDKVASGRVLAVLDRVEPALRLAQARANVDAARAQVAAANAGYDLEQSAFVTTRAQAQAGVAVAQANLGESRTSLDTETQAVPLAVDQARASLVSAQAAAAHATVGLDRARTLTATGDLSRQALDDAVNAAAAAAAGVRAASDSVRVAETNRNNVQLRALAVDAARSQRRQSVAVLDAAAGQLDAVRQRQAQVRVAESQLAQAQAASGLASDQLRETQIVAPFDGYVISHALEVGDLVQVGSAVMTLGDLDHPYVDVYVSDTDVPHVRSGTRANVTIDGMPGHTYVGTVTQISTTAEFTPENVQTKEQRIEYLVFRVRIQFTDTTGALKPGLSVDAVIPR